MPALSPVLISGQMPSSIVPSETAMPSASPILILPCTLADGPDLATNNMTAFWYSDKTWKLVWTNLNKTLPYVIAQCRLRMPNNLLSDRDHRRHVKAVDSSTGQLMGYIRFELPTAAVLEAAKKGEMLWEEAQIKEVRDLEERKEIEKVAKGADWEMDHRTDVLDEAITHRKREYLGRKRYINLDYLAVHPDFQGRGIASALVRAGLDEAEKLGLDVFVFAFKAGFRVYEKAGFKLLESLTQDATHLGGDSDYEAHFMEYIVGISHEV